MTDAGSAAPQPPGDSYPPPPPLPLPDTAATAPAPNDVTPPPAGVFYKLDSTRITLREYAWGSRFFGPAVGAVTKLLRIQLPGSTDDLNVLTLQPFEVPIDALPPDVRARFEPVLAELTAAGFRSPVFHRVDDPFHSSRTCLATFRHESGRALGRVHYRVWGHSTKVYFFPEFVTEFADGTYLWSTAAKPDMAAPPSCRVNRQVGATASALWASHQTALQAQVVGGKSVVAATTDGELRDASERHHAALRDFHLRRGAFAPMTPEDTRLAAVTAESHRASEAAGFRHPDVLAELDKLQRHQGNWRQAMALLLVSLVLFVGAGRALFDWELLFLLVPILLVHELGHYVAMRVFRYRNLRMFFIPFFGAAVSGRNYNVPGWKKAIVSLMGPVPGIFLGIGLGAVGVALGRPMLVQLAFLTLALNGFNLLPFLPLDGGWVMHAILFSRHYVLDVAFRAAAALALAGLGLLAGTKVLMFLGIFMLIGTFPAYKLARLVYELRRWNFVPASPDDQTIPAPAAEVIIDRVKAVFPRGLTNKMIAQHTLHVFETLNARPPGVAGSLGLAAVHGVSFLAAAAGGVGLAIFQHGGTERPARAYDPPPRPPPRYVLDAGADLDTWRGAAAGGRAPGETHTIVATFPRPGMAAEAFDDLRGRLPPAASVQRFGQSLLVALPAADAAATDRWVVTLQDLVGVRPATLPATAPARWRRDAPGPGVLVDRAPRRVALALSCLAPDEATAGAIQREADEFFRAPHNLWLVPPWHPADPRAPDERARHRTARRTYARALDAAAGTSNDAEAREQLKRIRDAALRGDEGEVDRLRDEQLKRWYERRRRKLEALRRRASQGDPDLDAGVIDAYTALLAESEDGPGGPARPSLFYGKAPLVLGPHMGQLPLAGGEPAGGAERFSPAAGGLHRTGLRLQFDWLSFHSPADGAPALVNWLASRGCGVFRYEFHPPLPDWGDESGEETGEGNTE